LPKLSRALDRGADVAIGSRRLNGSDVQIPPRRGRFLSGRILHWVARAVTGLPFKDTQCGFKLFTRRAADEIFTRSREDGWPFDVEALCVARERGLEVAEVPVVWRDSGESRVRTMRDAPRTLRGLAALASSERFPGVFRRQVIFACGAGLLVAMLLRGFLLGLLPLYDATEGRYASIALDMDRGGDWITPWCYHNGERIPFWGKPPLHFWLTALSFKIFGANEWAARFPSYLAGIGILALLFVAARRSYGPATAWLATLVAASACCFYLFWGTAVLDVTASLCVAGALVSFLMAQTGSSEASRKGWGLAGFASLGFGMLAKGPVVVVLSLVPILGWRLLTRRAVPLKPLPWVRGTALFLGISLPWYLLAERATPGFLRYFFVNEHLRRYVSSHYGDKYGHAHVFPWGSAWGMLAASFFPWTLLAVLRIRRRPAPEGVPAAARGSPPARRSLRARLLSPRDPWESYFVLWGLSPAIFFTFSRSILPAYLLPGLAGLSTLVARRLWDGAGSEKALLARFATVSLPFVVAPWIALLVSLHVEGVGAVAAACLGVGIVLAGIFAASLAFRSVPALLGMLPFSVAGTFVSGALAFAPVLERNSAKEAVRAALSHLRVPEGRVVVPRCNSGTLVFYGGDRLRLQPGPARRNWSDEWWDGDPDILLLNKKDVARMPPEALRRMARVGNAGNFVFYATADATSPPKPGFAGR
jgi:4-amino-4-deoxy-L-arabinose transferase-like glycosyltransferase